MPVSDEDLPGLEFDVIVHAIDAAVSVVLDGEAVGVYYDALSAARAGRAAARVLRGQPLPPGVRLTEPFRAEVEEAAAIVRARGGDPARALVTVRPAGAPAETESEVRCEDDE